METGWWEVKCERKRREKETLPPTPLSVYLRRLPSDLEAVVDVPASF
jgi:hypothetical protein